MEYKKGWFIEFKFVKNMKQKLSQRKAQSDREYYNIPFIRLNGLVFQLSFDSKGGGEFDFCGYNLCYKVPTK